MIIEKESPLRRFRADLAPQQASFLDGIRISAEMLDIAYTRLSNSLWQVSNDKQLEQTVACLFLDAWAVIDSVHRLRNLLDQMPGLKKSGPKCQLFQRNTQTASDFRNTIQHLRSELKEMADRGWPSWGSLAWIAVLDVESRLISSCLIVPGRVQSGTQELLNPAEKEITRPIDHVTLFCKSDRVSLTALYLEVEKIIRVLEPRLSEYMTDQPTLATDFFAFVNCKLERETLHEGAEQLGE